MFFEVTLGIIIIAALAVYWMDRTMRTMPMPTDPVAAFLPLGDTPDHQSQAVTEAQTFLEQQRRKLAARYAHKLSKASDLGHRQELERQMDRAWDDCVKLAELTWGEFPTKRAKIRAGYD